MEIEKWMRKYTNIGGDWDIDSVSFEDEPLRIDVNVSYSGELKCPVCGKNCTKYDERTGIWKEANPDGTIVNIIATFPRVKCPLHGIHEIDIQWAGKQSGLRLSSEKNQ